MYHHTTLLVAILTFVSGFRVLAQSLTTTLAWDSNYDNAALPLSRVACSDGPNGLETKNYTTLGSIPSFPNVGGAYTVLGWNSPECGTCYAVTYENTTIKVLAVDVSKTGFTISKAAMNILTGNQAVVLGRVNVTSISVSPSECGLPASN